MAEAVTKVGWRSYLFDEIATMVNDRVDNPKDAGVDRYVGLEHLDPESLRIRRWGSPSDVTATKLRFRTGDIIFGRRRVYQRKLAVADFDGICSAHALVLRSKPENVHPEFLPFFMQSDLFMERAKEISVGSLSPTINWKTLARQEFALPALDEQRRITELFEAARSVEESIRRIIDAAAQSRAAYLSSRELKSDRERIPLGGLLAAIEPGRSLSGASKAPGADEFGVLKVSAVDPNGFQPMESKALLDPADFDPRHQVHRGDLLMTRANTAQLVGETCIVHHDVPNLMLSDKTLRLVPADGVDASVLWYLLQGAEVRSQIKSFATGTGGAMKNISQSKIRRIELTYPSDRTELDELRSIIRALVSCYEATVERQRVAASFRQVLVHSILVSERS